MDFRDLLDQLDTETLIAVYETLVDSYTLPELSEEEQKFKERLIKLGLKGKLSDEHKKTLYYTPLQLHNIMVTSHRRNQQESLERVFKAIILEGWTIIDNSSQETKVQCSKCYKKRPASVSKCENCGSVRVLC